MNIDAVDFYEVPVGVLANTVRHPYEAGPEVLATKGTAGAKRVHEQFTWSHAADWIERALCKLTNGT